VSGLVMGSGTAQGGGSSTVQRR